jgi:hypothetical protein
VTPAIVAQEAVMLAAPAGVAATASKPPATTMVHAMVHVSEMALFIRLSPSLNLFGGTITAAASR